MAFDSEQIHKLAMLARIKIKNEQIDEVAKQLENIMALVDQMAAVDTDNIKPLSHPQDPTLRLRDDVVTETDNRDAFLKLTKHTQDGLYLVPKVIE